MKQKSVGVKIKNGNRDDLRKAKRAAPNFSKKAIVPQVALILFLFR